MRAAALWFTGMLLAAGVVAGQEWSGARDRSDIRVVSSFVAAGEPVPEQCRQEAHVFARSLARFPRPADWHWVLVCDEAGWRRFLRLTSRGEDEAIYASTDLEARVTYIRGFKLLDPLDSRTGPDEIVSHELAHIRLQTSGEAEAEQLARSWRGALREGSASVEVGVR